MKNYLVADLLHYCNVSLNACEAIGEDKIDYYDLTFVLKGQMTYTADGNVYVVKKNDAILLPPGTLRSRLADEAPVKFVSFNFTTFSDAALPADRFLQDCISEEVRQIVAAFPQNHLSPYFHSKEKVANILNYVLYELLDTVEVKTRNEHVLHILKFVEEHITEKMSLQSISRMIGLSKEYTAFIFKKETRKTVSEHVNERKMLFAKEIILHNEMSLTALSSYLGYDNYHYFSRLFKRYFKVTPKELKNRK